MRTKWLLPLILMVPMGVLAQTSTQRPTVRAQVRQGSIAVDGKLSEAERSSPAPASEFRQQDPKEGEPATNRTEVRFVYDADALYIGARMYDTGGAAGVRSRLARRDQVNEGDNLQFV